MKPPRFFAGSPGRAAAAALVAAFCVTAAAPAQQSGDLAQKVAQIRQSMAANAAKLARYTWQLDETVSVRGDLKSEMLYSVQIGAGGRQVKTPLTQPPAQRGRRFGIRHRIEDNVKNYAEQVGALAQSYSPLDPAKLQQLYTQGNVALKPAGKGFFAIVLAGYEKPGDSVTLTLSANPKTLVGVNVSSYLSDPSDAVTMQVQYASLPDGTRYARTVTIEGKSKDLTIVDQASNFTLKS